MAVARIPGRRLAAVAVVTILGLHPPSGAGAAPAEAYRLQATWTVAGAPERVVVAGSGDIYVLTAGGTRVERRSAEGVALSSMSVTAGAELAVDDAGSVYVVSASRNIVTKYGGNGVAVWVYSLPSYSHPALPEGRPPYATAIAWHDTLERVYVAYDYGTLESGLGFRLRTYTRGGVSSAGFAVAGVADTYGDAAARGGAVHMVNRTRTAIEVYQGDTLVRRLPLAEPADRLAPAADGSYFAVARRRWVYQYDGLGTVLGSWDALDVNPDPLAGSVAADVDTDAAGRVYVADPGHNQVRVYARNPDPGTRPDPPPAPVDLGCQALPDKRAEPRRLRLGDRTKVTLRLDGSCPEVSERADIMLVVDVSGSMEGAKLTAAKDAIAAFMALKDSLSPPGRDRIGLASFELSARLVVPLTENSSAVVAAAGSLTANGGTNIGAGIDQALAELTGPRRRADAQPIIVLMTDGNPTSVTGAASLAAADRARNLTQPAGCYPAGTCSVRMYAIGLGSDVDGDFLSIVATTPAQYYYAPDPSTLADVYARIARRIYATELFKSVRIVDRIPANMTYVTDSAEPAATYEPAGHSLTWDLGIVPFSGTELSYWLLPEDVGTWPTNIVATYDGPDGLGEPLTGEFPIPVVIVEADTPTPTVSPSPTPTPTASTTPSPTPTVTVSPTPVTPDTATPTPTASVTPSSTPTDTATAVPSTTPSPTPDRYSIYVVILYNNECFKRYADVALVIDASTTMLFPDGNAARTKLEAAKDAARAFLDELTLEADRHGRNDQAAIVWFNETAAVASPLTSDRRQLDAALESLRPVEGSRIDLGLRQGQRAVSDPARHILANTPMVVLLSDGIPNHTTFEEMFRTADEAKRGGIIIFAAGYGSDVQDWALRRVASQPDHYFYAPTGGELRHIYEQIAGQVVCR